MDVLDRGKRVKQLRLPACCGGSAYVYPAYGRLIRQHGRTTCAMFEIAVMAHSDTGHIGNPSSIWDFGIRNCGVLRQFAFALTRITSKFGRARG